MAKIKAERYGFRISPELKKKMQAYCLQKHTNITDVVTRFFVRLLEEEERKKGQESDAEQI